MPNISRQKIALFVTFIVFVLLVFGGMKSIVLANDFNSELGAGGLVQVQSKSISMEREDLFLSKKEVRVRYEFRNVTSSLVKTRVAFPMPEMPHMDGSGPTTSAGQYNIAFPFPVSDPNFLNFKIWVNQREVKPELELRALLPDGKDISAELLKIGGMALLMRPGFFGNEEFNKEYGPIDTNTKRRLKQLNAFVDVPEYGGYKLPWTVHITFHWKQEFPPGITIIEHQYKPLIGGGLIGFGPKGEVIISGMQEYQKDFCVDAPLARRLNEYGIKNGRRIADVGGHGYANILSYIIQTARSWNGPIGTFHLTIQGDAETENVQASLTSLCTDLPLRKTAAQRFEATVKNYIPKADLRILFINLPK